MLEMKPVNILTIDGGGARGLITLQVLKEVEDRLGKPLFKVFDYVAGTSTGGIIASLIASGYSIESIIDFYKKHLPSIFEGSFFRRGWLRPKYSDKYLNRQIKEVFKDKALKDTVTNLIVPAYNISKKDKKIFKSYKDDNLLFDVVRSTLSAQSYFKPHNINGDDYIDGGMVINNPSLISYVEAIKRESKSSRINLFSFGTGINDTKINIKDSGGGMIFWAKPTVDILLNEQSKMTDHFCENLISRLYGNYFRFEPEIRYSSHSIDDVSEVNMKAMEQDGLDFVADNKHAIEKVVSKIRYTS